MLKRYGVLLFSNFWGIERFLFSSYPPDLLLHALLLRVSRRAVRIQFSRAQILVQHLEVWVSFEDFGIDWREHFCLELFSLLYFFFPQEEVRVCVVGCCGVLAGLLCLGLTDYTATGLRLGGSPARVAGRG